MKPRLLPLAVLLLALLAGATPIQKAARLDLDKLGKEVKANWRMALGKYAAKRYYFAGTVDAVKKHKDHVELLLTATAPKSKKRWKIRMVFAYPEKPYKTYRAQIGALRKGKRATFEGTMFSFADGTCEFEGLRVG